MTPLENYNQQKQVLFEELRTKESDLERWLKQEQEKCKHKWRYANAVFYALGNTAPGKVCDKCGARRKISNTVARKHGLNIDY